MLFAIDVGNTNIVMGAFKDGSLYKSFRIATSTERTRDEYGMIFLQLLSYNNIKAEEIKGVIISSVVPPVMYSLVRAVEKYMRVDPVIVTKDIIKDINILYDNPGEVGADRLVNAFAAIKKYGGPLIIIDFGTATTFCAVDGRNNYLGGAICPGVKISLDALFTKTAKLPWIEISKPERVIGKSTVASMQSGVFFGYLGQIEYLVDKLKDEMREENIKVIATGGLSRMFYEVSEKIDHFEPNLTLEGLKYIYESYAGDR